MALIAGGQGVRRELQGTTLVDLPGSLGNDECATVDFQDRRVEPARLG